jgi:hypothetical protein
MSSNRVAGWECREGEEAFLASEDDECLTETDQASVHAPMIRPVLKQFAQAPAESD